MADGKRIRLKPVHILQFGGQDIPMTDLEEKAKAEYKKAGNKGAITELKIYVKPRDNAAYFVVNGTFSGKIDLVED